MLIPGLNQLAEPEIVKVEAFESLLAEFKAEVLAYVQAHDPERAARLAEALENDSDLLAMILQAFTLRLQSHERKYNTRIKQMLAWWAEGSNLDARLADMGLERRQIAAGDPGAFPAVPPVLESDDDARLRYYLAPHAPAAGSRLHYRREALTLGDRAAISVERQGARQLVVTYTFDEASAASQVKDATAVRTAPGLVTVTVLGRSGSGAPDAALLGAVRAHFARDDVAPETDTITVEPAEILAYQQRAIIYINVGPDAALVEASARSGLESYAAQQHRLQGYVDPAHITAHLVSAGAARLEIIEPAAPIECTASQAPYCTGIEIEVRAL